MKTEGRHGAAGVWTVVAVRAVAGEASTASTAAPLEVDLIACADTKRGSSQEHMKERALVESAEAANQVQIVEGSIGCG